MNKKILTTVLFSSILVLLLSNTVFGLGVTPGKKIIEFEPKLRTENTLTIVNTDYKQFRAALLVRGELEPYIQLSQSSISFEENEGEKQVSYEMLLPTTFSEPGVHEAEIVVREIPSSEQGGTIDVGALISIVSKVQVRVPYPGKYAESHLDILSDTKNVQFILRASNLGEEDIAKAKAVIYVYDTDNNLLSVVQTTEQELKMKQRKEFIASWDANVSLGGYRATAIFDYDGVVNTINKEFTLGNFFVRPIDLSVENFKLGDVAKFNLLVENIANTQVNNFVSELKIFNADDVQVAAIQSVPDTLPPESQKELNLFWVTENVVEGNYHGKLILKYGEKSSERDIRLAVSKKNIEVEIVGITGNVILPHTEKPAEESSSTELLLGMMIMLVIILVIVVLVLIILYIKKGK